MMLIFLMRLCLIVLFHISKLDYENVTAVVGHWLNGNLSDGEHGAAGSAYEHSASVVVHLHVS
jgi:hypothetical protein